MCILLLLKKATWRQSVCFDLTGKGEPHLCFWMGALNERNCESQNGIAPFPQIQVIELPNKAETKAYLSNIGVVLFKCYLTYELFSLNDEQ